VLFALIFLIAAPNWPAGEPRLAGVRGDLQSIVDQ